MFWMCLDVCKQKILPKMLKIVLNHCFLYIFMRLIVKKKLINFSILLVFFTITNFEITKMKARKIESNSNYNPQNLSSITFISTKKKTWSNEKLLNVWITRKNSLWCTSWKTLDDDIIRKLETNFPRTRIEWISWRAFILLIFLKRLLLYVLLWRRWW